MILSKRHRFLFIKGRKVAGTSVEICLSSICGSEDIVTPITPIDEKSRLLNSRGVVAQNYGAKDKELVSYMSRLPNRTKKQMRSLQPPKGTYYNHIPLAEILTLSGYIIDKDWTIFAVERCPYRKIISMANWRLHLEEYRQNASAMSGDIHALKRKVQEVLDDGSFLAVRNIDLYKDNEGNLCPIVLRFERLEKELRELILRLDNKCELPKLGHYKKGVSYDDTALLNIISKEQRLLINQQFEEEFNCFNYKVIE